MVYSLQNKPKKLNILMKTILLLTKGILLWTKSLFVKKEQPKQFVQLDPWDDEHFGDNIHFT